MGRTFCVDVRRVFGHDSKESKDESSSSRHNKKHKSKKKWGFGRSNSNRTPSPPVERNTPSPVPLQPSPPVEKTSPSPVPPQPSPPVERNTPSPVEIKSPSPVPSPLPSPPPIRVTPLHITLFNASSPIPITPVHITPIQEIVHEPVTVTTKQINDNFSVPIEPITIKETEVIQVEEEEEEEYEEIFEEVVPTSDVATSSSQSKEEIAAIKIQSLYRGYLARRAVRALNALVRLKTLVDGDSAKHQTASAMKAMQSLTRIQSQVRSRRIRMQEDNQALHAQLQLKHQRDLEKLKLTEDWNGSLQSKEQVEKTLFNRHEAAQRRERALAYAFSHQWKASSRSMTTTFLLDPTNPQWGWGYLDRWMGGPRLSETSFTDTKNSRKSQEINKLSNNPFMSPERPSSPALSRTSIVSVSSPKKSSARSSHFSSTSSVLSGGPSSRSYMQPTESARAKSRLVRASTDQNEKEEIIEEPKEKVLVKKRLSFSTLDNKSGMTANQGRGRRHVGPVKSSDVSSVKSFSSLA